MKKKTMKKVSSLALASTLVVAGLPFQSVAGAATLSSVATNLHKQVTLNNNFQGGFISPKLNTASTENVKVIVTMSAQPTVVGKYAASQGNNSLVADSSESAIKAQQASVLSAAKAKGIDLSVSYQFTTILNGMEVSVPANKIPELAKIPGVLSVFENSTYYAIPDQQSDTSEASDVNYDSTPLVQIGAPEVWAKGFTGKGVKVGVIDTGVDYLHPDLAPNYVSGYDSYFKDSDPYEEGPVAIEDDPYGTGFEGTSHGTHVSGTIAGHASNPTSDIVQKGVAFEAELHVYKVLGRNPVTGRSSGSSAQVIDGIERAVKDGMNVINLSLGSDSEKDPNSPDSIAINNAVLAGVTAVIANGNAADAQPDQYYYSMGSPASSQLAISVGATTSSSNHYDATTKSSFDPALDYKLNVMGWSTGKEDFAGILGTDPLDAVYVGLGGEADYDGLDVTGKVVFVSRGTYAFVDKIKVAKEHGAKAAIIFNGNVKNGAPDLSDSVAGRDGNIGSTAYLGDSFEFIPSFDMSGKEGRALARQVLANPGTPLKFNFGAEFKKTVVAGDTMATFSSRGPASDGSYGIKPDVSAPGVNILSTWPAYKKYIPGASYSEAYNRISGTSMATPHVAGMAVLIKQAHPDWTPFDIRAALANTADVISDASGKQYDVYSQGAGRTNVAKAVETNALLQTVDPLSILDKNLQPMQITNYNDNASFGLMQAGTSKSETLQLKNTADSAATYKASIKMHPSVTSDPNHPIATPDVNDIDVSLTGLDAGDTVTANGKSAKQFGLQVAPQADAVKGVYEGEVLLEADGVPSLHIPFSVHVGDQPETNGFGLQDATLSDVVIAPEADQDGNGTTDLSFNLTATDVNYIELNVYGLDDEQVGTLRTRFTEQPDGSLVPIAPGIQKFDDLDNSYTTAGSDEIKHLAPGAYKLEILAAGLNKNGNVISKHVYTTYKALGVANSNVYKLVMDAKNKFLANVSNTTVVNKPVLSLPANPGLVYEVTKSSDNSYINSNGVLQKLPTTGSVNVDLNVRIMSTTDSAMENPSYATNVKVTVQLNAPSTKPYLLQAGSLDRTNGIVAKANVVQNPNGNVYSGNPVVVFQLMKGNTPLSLVAVSKSSGSNEVTAQFPNISGDQYWVQAYVVDAINSANNNVPVFLTDVTKLGLK